MRKIATIVALALIVSLPMGALSICRAQEAELKIAPYTQAAFEDFGKVLAIPSGTPTYSDQRLDWWSTIGVLPGSTVGDFEVSLLTCRQSDMTFNSLERHVQSPELLLALDDDIISAFAPARDLDDPGARPALEEVRAFKIPQNQGFLVGTGTWHLLPTCATKDECLMLVIFKRDTGANDLTFAEIEGAERVRLVYGY